MIKKFDVTIIGSGPAGLTAGIYTSRAKLSTILLEKENFGGYVPNIELVDNYTGLANISGQSLSANMIAQIKQFDAKLALTEAVGISMENDNIIIDTDADRIETKAVIIASGANPRKLNIPGEQEFTGKGVFYCAACDGYQYQDKIVAVAGGGDSALTEAFNLSKIAAEIILIEIETELTGTCILRDKVIDHPKIEVLCGVKIERINGNGKVKSLDLLDMETQAKGQLDIDGILVHIGRSPNTRFVKDLVPLSENGFILVDENMQTQVPGFYAAGDVRQHSPMQIISACGDGAAAAISVIKRIGSM